MRKILLLVFSLIFLTSYAEHITGGDFTIIQTGPNDFTGKLVLFSDGNALAMDIELSVGVFDALTDELIQTITLADMVSEEVLLGNEYYQPDLNILQLTYTGNFTLTNNPNGYYLTWERCCRNLLSDNVDDVDMPMVFTVSIPDPAIVNSSPDFEDYPNEGYFCLGSTNILDFSAVDPDGDSLVYSLSPALAGEATSIMMPIAFPNPRPYLELTYIDPYSTDNYIGGEPAMSIDPATGVITADPENLGFFTIAARVEEYRDGVKIGEVRREIQLATLFCVGVDSVGFELEINEMTVSATNLVPESTTWHWNFGDGNSSNQENPIHSYASEGTYNVSLSVATETNGTYHYTREITVEDNALAVKRLQDPDAAIIFPNPAGTTTTIKFAKPVSQNCDVQLLSADGRIVKSFQVKEGMSDVIVDLTSLKAGIYFTLFREKGKLHKYKLLVI